jgi:predicted transglutaminase-like cysteine proteinase
MIRSDKGDYILDNKTNAVLPWGETGYVYVKREGQESTAWVSLGGVTSPTATANR